MSSEISFPYEAIAVKKYKSPHKNDLSFAKGDRVRVTAFAPKDDDEEEEDEEDDDRWLIGETLDGTKTGTFPASHVELATTPAAAAPLAAPIEKEESSTTESAKVISPIPDDESEQIPKPEPVREIPSTQNTDTASTPKEAEQIKATPAVVPVEQPAKKPSSPPLAPKPSGLAARIAAFNKPQDAPPPIPRGKPGGGWKPPPPAPGGPKPILPGPSAAQLNRTTNRSAEKPVTATEQSTTTPESVVESQKDKANAGFSAADAQTSIKMSLKERMAALQRNETSSSQREAAAVKPAPKPAPGRIDEEKRAAALASMGSPTKQNTEESVAREKEDATEDTLEKGESEAQPKETTIESEEAVQISTTNDEGEEKTEEEIEAERRAAIAKRMAALGGRRMGGGQGPAMFGAPAPVSKPRKLSTDSRSTIEADTGTNEVTAPAAVEEIVADKEEEEAPSIKSEKTLAVPRRTAPPRKKKSSTSSQPTSASPSMDEPARQQSIQEGEEMDHSKSHGLAAGAAVAGAAGIGAAALTEEPRSALDEDKEEEKSVETSPNAPQVIEPEAEDSPPIRAERRPTQDSIISRKTEQSAITDADSFEPSTPVSQSELEEHARQLEAFVRTPEAESNGTELEEDIPATQQHDESEDELDTPAPIIADKEPAAERATISSPPPPNIAPPRPPSARPPVPKSSLPPVENDDAIQRLTSPPPSRAPPAPKTSLPLAEDDDTVQRFASPPPIRAPPIPKSSLPPAQEDEPRTLSPAPTRAPPIPSASPVGRRESSLMASVEDLQDDDSKIDASPAPVLAAPKPRMAVPADESDDEGEPAQEETPAPAPAEELTEEEEERQRRSRLAERMARMGGMPIMGAPMPFRKPPKPATEPEEEVEKEPEVEELPAVDEPQEEDNDDDLKSTEPQSLDEEDKEEEPIITASSPPPIPTKSPPPPSRSPDMAKRASQSFGVGGDLARSGSTRARPPMPIVSHSRGATNEEIAELEAAANPIASQEPQRIASPPPRPPSRAPPGRQGSIASIGQIQQDSSFEGGLARAPSMKLDRSGSIGSAKVIPTSSSSLKGVQPSAPSARDIDLMPSSQWWRHGRPIKLPPTLMRPDAVRTVNVQDEGSTHLIRIDLLFEDYSSTAISVKYQDDDANEEQTEIAQKHNFAPGRPQTQEMMSWSQQLGARIARQASTFLSKGGQQTQVGDGTSKGFITALIALSTNENALPPVGSSFGAIVLAQAATTPVDQGSDEIRPGDIVALHGADLKGKRGLTPYHVTYGTTQEPAFACVLEATSESSKKRKLRCILVPTSSGKTSSKSGLPEEVSLRLDDVKSGLLRVFRVAPKHGWLPE